MLSKITWKICKVFVLRMKNNNFILESKMAELDKKENSKQSDWPDAAWNFILPWK